MDDGRSLRRLTDVEGLDGNLSDHRFYVAAADGQGGAMVCGWHGLVVRVATDPQKWSAVASKRPVAKETGSRPPAPPKPRASRDEDAFIADIRAAPADDGPRLVYADWLLEHQDPRGEFIQIQCMLGRAIYGSEGYVRDSNPPLPNLLALEKREAALYEKHRKQWMAPFAKVVRKFRWRRGFFEGFTSGKTFCDHASAIFAAHPLVELRLQGLGRNDIAKLADTPLPGLETLDISRQRLTPELLQMVAGSRALAELRHLDLWGNEFGDEGARVIATSIPANLKSLRLAMCNVAVTGLLAILDADAPALEEVSIWPSDLNDAQKREVGEHPRGSLVRWSTR